MVTGGGTDWRHYIQAEGQVVAIVSRTTSGNAVYYPLEDAQGSGSTLTDSSGTNLVRQSYNAFGLPRDGSDWDGAVSGGDQATINGISRRGYTSHSMLGNMGLIHMNGRVQDAITGRFLSPDLTIPDAGYTQSYNRYAYVNNNPMSFTDPSGFTPFGGGGDYMLSSSDVLMGLVMCQDDNGDPCAGWDAYHEALARENYAAVDALRDSTLAQWAQRQAAVLADYEALITTIASCVEQLKKCVVSGSGDIGQAYAGSYDFRLRSGPPQGSFHHAAVSPLTDLGNIAHMLVHVAAIRANPGLVGRLRTEVPVKGGGKVDLVLDNQYAYELKPMTWQYGKDYSSARAQLDGYLRAGNYSAGSWAQLGIPTSTVGMTGTFTFGTLTVTGGFAFGYDNRATSSGLLFYYFMGVYDRHKKEKASGDTTFFPTL